MENIILAFDMNTAIPVAVQGWKDRHGKIHLSEEAARYASASHVYCSKCGNVPVKKPYTICDACSHILAIERYNKLQYKECDGKTPIYSETFDIFFNDVDELTDYCSDNDFNLSELRLKLCDPNYFKEIDIDYWSDDLAEDQDELPKKLQDTVNTLNEIIRTLPPASWTPSKFRTDYNDSIGS